MNVPSVDIISLLESQWLWVLLAFIGMLIFGGLRRSKTAKISNYVDVGTVYFGICFFIMGFIMPIDLLGLIISKVGSSGGITDNPYTTVMFLVFAFLFFILIKGLFKTKWFKPIGIIILCFIIGSVGRGIYEGLI